jgi:arylsulfatase/arylsulfatase A
LLSRQDWRGPDAGWTPKSRGGWELDAARSGPVEVRLLFARTAAAARVRLSIGGRERTLEVASGVSEALFRDVELSAGPLRLDASVDVGGETLGVLYAELRAAD